MAFSSMMSRRQTTHDNQINSDLEIKDVSVL